MYISHHSVMEGQRHNNPLNLRCFVYNGPKGMELAPNPSYSGGSISAHHLLCNFIIFNILPCFLLFMYASYYTGLFCMSCIMFMCLLYMCITVLLFWRKKGIIITHTLTQALYTHAYTPHIKISSKHNQLFWHCWRFGLYQRPSSEEETSSSDEGLW